jgi:hypothetical protein
VLVLPVALLAHADDHDISQDFGIRFGYERVVLHLEPRVPAGRLQCNTARTLLLLDHEPLPWARWGEEFTAAMPDDIRQLQERAATPTASHAGRRSAAVSARSCRSTASAATAQHNRHSNHPPGRGSTAPLPVMSLPVGRRRGSRRAAPRPPRARCTHSPTQRPPWTGRAASPPRSTPIAVQALMQL